MNSNKSPLGRKAGPGPHAVSSPNGHNLNGDGDQIDPADLSCARAVLRRSLGHRVGPGSLRQVTTSPRWAALFQSVDETAEGYREGWPSQWCGMHANREKAEADLMRRAIAS